MKKFRLLDWFFFLSLFFLFLIPAYDPDLGWQIRCGELFWTKGQICHQNQFSVFLSNYPWSNHHWLYQILLYPLWRAFDLWGLTMANSLLVTASFLVLYLAIKNFRLEKQLAFTFSLFVTWTVFYMGLRSQLLGFFYFSLIILVFTSRRQKTKFLLPLIILLWVNSHGSFALGLVLIALFWIKSILHLTFRKSKNIYKKEVASLGLIFLLCLAVTLINPFGLKIYSEVFRHFGPSHLEKEIAEWVPPIPATQRLILITGVLVFFLLLLTEKVPDFLTAFFPLPFIVLALQARRHLPFFFLFSAFLIHSSRAIYRLTAKWRKQEILRNILSFLLILYLLACSFIPQLSQKFKVNPFKANRSWHAYCRNSLLTYPCDAVEFLKKQKPGNIFNRYEWGGFLIWQLPEYKIFVDGRMPAWPNPGGKTPYAAYLETLQNQPGWEKTLADYNIRWIFISPGTFMDLKLQPEPKKFGWQEVYRDQMSVIYQKI